MAYYKTKESVEEYISIAKDVNCSELIEKLTKILPTNSTLLELGSGPGTDWKILNKYYKVTGSDSSTEFLNHLMTENKDGKFLELDATTINTNLKFDGIYSNKVLHHLTDSEFRESVKRQSNILNPKGIVCHSFWKGNGSEFFKGLVVNYHDNDSLRNYYKEYFDIVSIENYKELGDDDSLLLIGRKKCVSPK